MGGKLQGDDQKFTVVRIGCGKFVSRIFQRFLPERIGTAFKKLPSGQGIAGGGKIGGKITFAVF